MDWILENLQIVVLIVGAFIYWLKNLAEKKIAERREQEEVSEPDEREGSDEYEWPPVDMPSVPPQREPGYEEAVASEAAAAEKHQQQLATRQRRMHETKATTTGGAAATRARVTAKGLPKAAVATPARLRKSLRDPVEVRRAVVIREVLGPPVGLR